MGYRAAFCGCCLLTMVAGAAEYDLVANSDLVGAASSMRLSRQDTLAKIAQAQRLGYRELLRANPSVDPWLPDEDELLALPTVYVLPSVARQGVVVNLAEYRLYYYREDTRVVFTAPVGIGRGQFPTPLFRSYVTTKVSHPSWTPPQSIREEYASRGIELPTVVAPGASNPLGSMAIKLAEPGYLLHGTNRPFGVGQAVSHGCLRLYAEDIEALAEVVSKGDEVVVVDEPYKVGWLNGLLYLEAHGHPEQPIDHQQWVSAIVSATDEGNSEDVDWALAEQVARESSGVPTIISRRR